MGNFTVEPLTIGFLCLLGIIIVGVIVVIASKDDSSGAIEAAGLLLMLTMLDLLFIGYEIENAEREKLSQAHQDQVEMRQADEENEIRSTVLRMAATERESWSADGGFVEIVNIDGKSFVRFGDKKYEAEKEADGSVFLYNADGHIAYGASPDGKFWKA